MTQEEKDTTNPEENENNESASPENNEPVNEHLLGEFVQEFAIEKELKQSYIDYAMTVIASRALPDTRDGLKPVLRRILFAMYDMKMLHNTKHKKSARIVGEVLGKYHPHGDSSVYDAMVRMAQPRSLRYPLVDGQGNFGSIDGDGAAAMRYTEARMTKVAEDMLRDIHQDTVDWRDNFDGSLEEPIMLPTKFPNHLCNGTMGIAVGMATNMPPHNLCEVIDASLLLIQKEGKPLTDEEKEELKKNLISAQKYKLEEEHNLKVAEQKQKIKEAKEAGEEVEHIELLPETIEVDESTLEVTVPQNYEVSVDEIMEVVKGPDFPTGGMIFDPINIKEVYRKGKGGIVMRGKTHIETDKKGNKMIIIDEIPYQVNKATLVSKIGELVIDKKLSGITDIRDESSKNKIRISIHIKADTNADKLLVLLYKMTDLQTNFNVNNVTLVEKGVQPRLLNIKDLLMEYVDFRRAVVYRRSVFQLKKAKDRLHILEGLRKAIDIIDDVIATIRGSNTKQEAKDGLMEKFDFSEPQAEHILLMRLQSLVGLEMQRIDEEIEEKKKEIEYLEGIINDADKLDGVVRDELQYIKDTYGDERRTQVSQDTSVYKLGSSLKALLDAADRVKEDCIVWIGNDMSVRVMYQTRVQNIPDTTIDLVYTHNQDQLIVITDKGELVVQRIKDFGSHKISDTAINLKKHFELKGEVIFAKTLHFEYDSLVLLTSHNNIKKIDKNLVLSFKKFPTTIMNLPTRGEKIVSVLPVREGDKMGVITQQGRFLLFPESDLRNMGKTAGGVKAIELQDEKDRIASMFLYKDEPFIFVYSAKAGKLLNIEDLRIRKRARKGDIIAEGLGKDLLRGGISIDEGAVTLKYDDETQEDIHSNDIHLDIPESGLDNLGKGEIKNVYRPREEKEENVKYKEEKKKTEQQEQQSEGLFSGEEENNEA